jgi:hypothetical protein
MTKSFDVHTDRNCEVLASPLEINEKTVILVNKKSIHSKVEASDLNFVP